MSPADPRFIGRGDDSSGGEVAYTLEEMRTLLQSQPGEMSGSDEFHECNCLCLVHAGHSDQTEYTLCSDIWATSWVDRGHHL